MRYRLSTFQSDQTEIALDEILKKIDRANALLTNFLPVHEALSLSKVDWFRLRGYLYKNIEVSFIIINLIILKMRRTERPEDPWDQDNLVPKQLLKK